MEPDDLKIVCRDMEGAEIKVGDWVAYATRDGSCGAAQRVMKVKAIVPIEGGFKLQGPGRQFTTMLSRTIKVRTKDMDGEASGH